MAENTCGGCTACCKATAVDELDKPEFEWCPSCSIGVGCKIYTMRPKSCAEYQCLWLAYGTESDQRPDKSRYVISAALVEGLGDIIGIHESRVGASEGSPFAERWKRFAMGRRMPILIRRETGRDTLCVPHGFDLTEIVRRDVLRPNTFVQTYVAA